MSGAAMNIIAGAGGVLLGPGWHPARVAGPEHFRGLTGDAIAYVPAIERIEYRVSIDLDAGQVRGRAILVP